VGHTEATRASAASVARASPARHAAQTPSKQAEMSPATTPTALSRHGIKERAAQNGTAERGAEPRAGTVKPCLRYTKRPPRPTPFQMNHPNETRTNTVVHKNSITIDTLRISLHFLFLFSSLPLSSNSRGEWRRVLFSGGAGANAQRQPSSSLYRLQRRNIRYIIFDTLYFHYHFSIIDTPLLIISHID
jgi:hypothetical protein